MTATYITKKAKNENVFTLCRSPDYATEQVYFPNRPKFSPATCTAVGTVVDDALTSTYEFGQGDCDNGRTLRPAKFVCSATKQGASCMYEGARLDFSYVDED